MLKTLLAAVTFLPLIGPLSAHANIIYNWTGDCQRILFGSDTPCTHATLHVVTTDAYIPGEEFFPHFPVPSPVLLEALYSDANTTFDLAFPWSFDGNGLLLPASFPGEGHMSTTATLFRSDANGVWRFEAEGASSDCDEFHNPFCGYGVTGINGVWTRVPAPSTLVLLGVGVAGLALLRRGKVS
jgi:hypothetical protein